MRAPSLHDDPNFSTEEPRRSALAGAQPVAAFTQLASLLDLLALLLSGLLWVDAGLVRHSFTPLEAHLIGLGLAALCWVAMLSLTPATLGRLLDVPWAIADAVLLPGVIGGGAALLAYFFADRGVGMALLLWPAAALSLLLPLRILLSGLAMRGVRDGWLRRRIALVGATDMAAELIHRLTDPTNPEIPDLVGVFDDRDATRRPPEVHGVGVQGDIAELCRRAQSERLDLIVIALPLSRAMDILRSVQQVQALTAEVVVLLEGQNAAPQGTRVSVIAGYPVLQLVRQPLQPGAVLAKGTLDYVGASVALLLLAPLLLVAALAIRLSGPGPVLFRQPRLGRNGRMFNILKLRTLRWDPADDGRRGVVANDKRVTRVGQLLRTLCIDELPQLINVLRGEMSLVGPRPHVAHMLVAGRPIEELVPGYGARHRMKPGITGWAQVNGLSGTMSDVSMARTVIAHDLAYISEWSLWLDLRILARTSVISLFGRNAFDVRLREWKGL
jgi:putative colanic acid biosynthesis UDP-glucose lipid carrier transferase